MKLLKFPKKELDVKKLNIYYNKFTENLREAVSINTDRAYNVFVNNYFEWLDTEKELPVIDWRYHR